MSILKSAIVATLLAMPATAQQFTAAAEVKPILEATKTNWVSVREYDGQDLLYFTHLLSWRCGIDEIIYAVNGGDETRWRGEPCYEGEAQPNALKADDMLPYVSFPQGSVESVTVRIEYDDGSTDSATFSRAGILIN